MTLIIVNEHAFTETTAKAVVHCIVCTSLAFAGALTRVNRNNKAEYPTRTSELKP